MDPLVISGLIGGATSLAGSFMNTSSQQAVNAQQLQFAQQQASGAFLPSFVANAQKAGINPLAALGYKSGGMYTPTAPTPGSGVAAAGAAAAQAADYQHIERMRDLEATKAQADINQSRMFTNRTQVELATNEYLLDYLKRHPQVLPAGASEPTMFGTGAEILRTLLTGHSGGVADPFSQGVGKALGPFGGTN